MTGFVDTLQGDGLARAQRALAGSVEDPQRVDHARGRFDESPPPYISDQSSTTTRSQNPNPPSEEQRRHQERRDQLLEERIASKPYHQFGQQTSDETKRIWNAQLNGTNCIPIGSDPLTIAHENVRKRWVEQGIWNNKWNQLASGRWKHEEPLDCGSDSETNAEEGPSSAFSFFPKEPPPPRQPKSEKEKRRIAKRRVVWEREREASRPYHQFLYQISKERELIQDESTSGEDTNVGIPDINTKAYENVKNRWTKRRIWNKSWGILPGMSWKHEEPFEEETVDSATPQANPDNFSHAYEAVPLRNIFGHPDTNLAERDTHPMQSNFHQVSSVMNPSQQDLAPNIGSTELENGDAERSPLPLN